MWFPELFNRFDEYARAHNGSEQALVCEVCIYRGQLTDKL